MPLDRYETLFVDSITVAGRLCFQWCKGQSQAFSDKTGKPDTRGAYGLHGQEMPVGVADYFIILRATRAG